MMIFTYVFVNRKKKDIYNDKCDCVSVIEYTWRDLMFFVYDTNTPWICFFLFIWYFTMLYSYVVWIRNFNGFCCYSFFYIRQVTKLKTIFYMILIDWITSKKKQKFFFLIISYCCDGLPCCHRKLFAMDRWTSVHLYNNSFACLLKQHTFNWIHLIKATKNSALMIEQNCPKNCVVNKWINGQFPMSLN